MYSGFRAFQSHCDTNSDDDDDEESDLPVEKELPQQNAAAPLCTSVTL